MKLFILILISIVFTACGNKQEDYEKEIKNIPIATVTDMFVKKTQRSLPSKYTQGTLKFNMQKAYSINENMYFEGVISDYIQVKKEEHLLIKSICEDLAFRAMFNKGIIVHYKIFRTKFDDEHIIYEINKNKCKTSGYDTEILIK